VVGGGGGAQPLSATTHLIDCLVHNDSCVVRYVLSPYCRPKYTHTSMEHVMKQYCPTPACTDSHCHCSQFLCHSVTRA
jgi:hypothetical protein